MGLDGDRRGDASPWYVSDITRNPAERRTVRVVAASVGFERDRRRTPSWATHCARRGPSARKGYAPERPTLNAGARNKRCAREARSGDADLHGLPAPANSGTMQVAGVSIVCQDVRLGPAMLLDAGRAPGNLRRAGLRAGQLGQVRDQQGGPDSSPHPATQPASSGNNTPPSGRLVPPSPSTLAPPSRASGHTPSRLSSSIHSRGR
jgi:hypothetical protein